MFDSESGRGGVDEQVVGTPDPWQRAYEALRQLGLQSGLTLPTKWFYEAMGIPLVPPRKPGEVDAKYAKRAAMWSLNEFEPQISKLRKCLLDDHGLWLHSLGAGVNREARYEIRNADASDLHYREVMRTVKKTLANGLEVQLKMSDDGLSSEQRESHALRRSKLASVSGLMEAELRKREKLGLPQK